MPQLHDLSKRLCSSPYRHIAVSRSPFSVSVFSSGLFPLQPLFSFLLWSLPVWLLLQWVGKPLVDRFVSEKHFQKFDFLKNGKRLELIVFLVFLLPGLPKDALTYLVSFDSKIKPLHLFLLTTLGRAPATALTIFAGKNLWDGNYKMALIFLAAMIVLCAAGFVVKKKIDARAKRRAEKEKKYE